MFKTLYIKNIINKLVKEECICENINRNNLNLYSITSLEYNLNIFFNKKFKLNGNYHNVSPKVCESFFNYRNYDLVIYLDDGKIIKRMITIISMLYH